MKRTYSLSMMVLFAAMVSDFDRFRKEQKGNVLFLIDKKDELFDWQQSMEIFESDVPVQYIIHPDATHLNIHFLCASEIKIWLHTISTTR